MPFTSAERWFVLRTWLISRLWLAAWAYAAHLRRPLQAPVTGGFAGVSSWWLNVWTSHDSVHYIGIAQRGYEPVTSAFFPLYPLLLRPFGPDENALALAGIIISNAATLVAFGLLLHLATQQYGLRLARRAVVVLAFFPTAVYSMAVYTDALFLMLSLGAFCAARGGRWAVAGTAALLAALTRNAGPVLAAALLLEVLLQRPGPWRARLTLGPWMPVCWALLPAAGFVATQAWFAMHFGRVTLLAAQTAFGRALTWPWMPIWRDVLDQRHDPSAVAVLNVACSGLVFILAWRHRHRLWWPGAALMVGVMLMQLTYARTFPTFTISSARYVFSSTAFAESLALELTERVPRPLRLGMAAVGVLVSGIVAAFFGAKAFVS